MSVAACAELVRRGDRDRFLSAMAAPPMRRARLFVLYAFNVEVSRAPWVSAEPLIAEMRLQWWADALDEIATGRTARAHEVVTPLAEIVQAHDLPTALFHGLIEARRFDLCTQAHAGQAAFDAYIDATSGNLMWLAARALGAAAKGERVVRDLAYGAGVAAYLRAVPALRRAGRCALPDDSAEAMGGLAEHALARIDSARAARGHVGRAAAPALLAGWRASTTLRAALRKPGRVFDGLLEEPEIHRRYSLLWRDLTGKW